MKKIIFLDIDGVLAIQNDAKVRWHPNIDLEGAFWSMVGFSFFNPSSIKALNKIIDNTGAQIVLSSTWRRGREEDFRDLVKYINHTGVKAKIIGRTPCLKSYKNKHIQRGHEIQAWINSYRAKIQSFVILDDESDMAHLRCKLVQSKDGWKEQGLTDKHANEAITVLNDDKFWDEIRAYRKRKKRWGKWKR